MQEENIWTAFSSVVIFAPRQIENRRQEIMEEKRTSLIENGLIWFGAAVSIAEIMTGTNFAPLGLSKGILAVLIGHVIGCSMLFLAGMIGGRTRKNTMEAVKMSFGSKGSLLFSGLNIIQLTGWTGIMIFDGALAANGLFNIGGRMWCVILGAMITLWILVGIRNLGKLNTIAMGLLFILTVALSFVIFGKGDIMNIGGEGMTFGAAVELSAAMPLSWLPLISDYTCEAEKPVRASAVSAVTYGTVSCWMYVIGMGAAIFAAETDVARIMGKAGLGAAGLLIVILSTVTTTFLDAYSAGVSGESIFEKIDGKRISISVTVIGTLGAIFLPLYDITGLLYFIGSVFAPMTAVQIADFYFLKKNREKDTFNVQNLVIWLAGFIIYRLLMRVDLIVGNTLPDMIITIVICVAAEKVRSHKKHNDL